MRFFLAIAALCLSVGIHAQTPPAIMPPATGAEKVTCVQSNVPKTCTTLQIATLALGKNNYLIDNYGGDPSGTNNNDAAFSAVLTAIGKSGSTLTGQGCIIFGPGTYKFSAQVTVTLSASTRNSFCLRGSGTSVSNLRWPNATGGINVTTEGQANSVQISDMSLLTGQVDGGDAINIRNNGAFGGGDGNVSNIVRVYIAGDDKTSLGDMNVHYWSTGITATAISNVNYDGVSIAGAGLSGLGRGIFVQGVAATSTFAVAHNVSNSYFYALDTGITYGTWFQGLTVSQSNFTNGLIGIAELPGTVGTDELYVVNCQFNTSADQVLLSNMTHANFIGNLFFIYGSNTSGISIQNAQMVNIIGNSFDGAAYGGTNKVGIFAADSLPAGGGVISGNSFSALSLGVGLAASTSGWNVQANHYASTVTLNVDNAAGGANSIGVATE